MMSIPGETRWIRRFPPASWLADYHASWLGADAIAGVTLAAYAIPVSLAYAGLAGLPPQVGVYGYLLGGVGYALLGSSRQLAVGPTSAISLMIAGAGGMLAGGDATRYGQIVSLVALTVAALCLIAWLFKLSLLVRLISDSILVGFKAGAGLTIIMSQLPSLFGVAGGGHNFFDRAIKLAGQLGDARPLVLGIGVAATVLLLLGERRLPGKPIGLAVVALSIVTVSVFGLAEMGLPVTGKIPTGLPTLALPTFGLLEFDDLFPVAAGCLVLAYVEGVSAARSFAAKHGYALDVRQEFLGLGAANLAAAFGHGYPVAGGLSQSAVNDAAGARTPLALVFCSITLALCLLFFTGLLTNLPKTVLGAIVFSAVYKLVDIPALARMWRISRIDFYAAVIALASVLFLGIIAFRPETSLLYVNAEAILETVLAALQMSSDVKLVACDLSASPFIDLAGSRMLHDLHQELASRGITFCIVGAHAQLRDLLQADGLADKTDSGDWMRTLDSVLSNRRPPAND
jgi:sulfate permease, SulP family